MAASPTEPPNPPPPPPPPPLTDNNSSNSKVSNGISSATQAREDAATLTGDETKPWQRAWSVDEMRKGATTWSLASDAGMLLYLQEFSQNMISQTHQMEQKVDGLVHETKGISAKVHNTFNDFLMLSNTQFVENRVYDEEETKDEDKKNDEITAQDKEKTREELESEVIPKINQAIISGLSVLENAFVTVEILPEQMSDEEDEGNLPENFRPEPILELTDLYAHRKLPCFIGTHQFQQDDLVGLAESSSEDEEASDNEASVKSDDQKSSDEEKSSESEDGTDSSSSSEEASTSSESGSEESEDSEESEKEVVRKKKPRKDSDEDLFASGGVKKVQSKETDFSEEESEDESTEQPVQKTGRPLDFSAELAAKLGVKRSGPKDSDEDQHKDEVEEQDWEESGRHDSEQVKEDLFSASVDTTSTVRSKGSKKKEKSEHKKRRSGSHTSHDSAVVTTVTSSSPAHPNDNELDQSGKHDKQDDLFTSSVDTTISTVSKSSKHKHKHKKKNARSDSQLSNASSKNENIQPKMAKKDDDNLFGASPEADLFDDGLSTPFNKKGGMFSGGSDLFDDVNDDEEETQSVKSENVNKTPSAQSINEDDESDGEVVPVKQKPRTSSSGKKLPAGAVAIFGDQGPFGHIPVQASEHAEKSHSTAEKKTKKEKPAGGGGGLFSDDGDDMFTSSQSSSVPPPTSKPSSVKAPKSIDMFGDDNDDEDDDEDSLFGGKPATKKEPKSQPPKKKLPAGAVSIFGASPPELFTSPSADVEPATSTANTSVVKNTSNTDGSGLFGEDDDSITSKTSSVAAVPIVSVKPKRKSNQISLFDDQEEEDEDDDLFSSIAPSKGLSNNKNLKDEQQKHEKKAADSKPLAKKSTISLFGDDEDEEDNEEHDGSGLSATQPQKSSTKVNEKPVGKKPSSKQVVPTGGLFGAEEDDLFSETKHSDPAPLSKSKVSIENKPHVKPSTIVVQDAEDLFDELSPKKPSLDPLMLPVKDKSNVSDKAKAEKHDSDDDLFAEPRSKQPSFDPLRNNEASAKHKPVKPIKPKTVDIDSDKDDLFTQSTQKLSSTDQLLPDSSTEVKTASKQHIDEQAKDLFDDEKNDVVESIEEPAKDLLDDDKNDVTDGGKVPTKTNKKLPGAVSLFGGVDMFAGQKLRKKPAKGDDLFGDDEDDLFSTTSAPPPAKPVPVVAPRTKPPKKESVEVAKVIAPVSQQKLPVQPVLPIPVSAAGKNSNIGKLQKTLVFNPATMLPGAMRPPKKEDDVSEATFDKPPSAKILETTARDRVRVRAQRRPPTRHARRAAANESMSDDVLFGSDISTKNNEEQLSDTTDGKPSTHIFNNSDDFFSSNSYQSLKNNDVINSNPLTSQTKTTKSNPLLDSFESTSTASSLFDDSIDGFNSKSEQVKPVKADKQKDSVAEIVPEESKSKSSNDLLFDKSNKDLLTTTIRGSSSQNILKVDDDDDEDDLFKSDRPLFSPPPLDFDSDINTSGDFMKTKTSNDEIFSKDSGSAKDIFASLSSTSHSDGIEKIDKKSGEEKNEDSIEPKESVRDTSSKTKVVDDLFGDTGSIFDDIPKKPKEKKKKKITTPKEDNIFDETQGTSGGQDVPSGKTSKKTKGKKKAEKKGKSKISIFDDDSPSIFDDPHNATSK